MPETGTKPMPEPGKTQPVTSTFKEPAPRSPLLDAAVEATLAREACPVLSAMVKGPPEPAIVELPAAPAPQSLPPLQMEAVYDPLSDRMLYRRPAFRTDLEFGRPPARELEGAWVFEHGQARPLRRVCRECGASVCDVAQSRGLYIYMEEEAGRSFGAEEDSNSPNWPTL